jgi:predicted aspartyl protease
MPMPELTATESSSKLDSVLPETCPLNLSVQQETILQISTPQDDLDVSKCTRTQKSVFHFISSMKMEKANHLLDLSSSTSVKGRMSKSVTEKVVNKSLLKKTYLEPTKTVHKDLMKHIEDTVCPSTHLSQGISRRSPVFNPTRKLGEQHVLCAPSKATVTETLEAFQKQQSNYSRATFIVDDTHINKKQFKSWKSLDAADKYQDVTKPIYVFTWKKQETTDVDELFKYLSRTHSMKFKGQVNGNPVCVLMDTGASGTAFVDRKYCKEESFPLYRAPPDLVIVLGDNSRVPSSHMATVTVKFGTYRFKVECLLVEKLPDYPLILGNPWLTSHHADLSFPR